MSTTNYDIIIAGSGPAGTACALALKGSGLRVLVLDKILSPAIKFVVMLYRTRFRKHCVCWTKNTCRHCVLFLKKL
ncbi:MAG: FAD-binding protein [Bacteroidetes bacterium]|nr:FAD-binding protein [Bacteroidota bacterium]